MVALAYLHIVLIDRVGLRNVVNIKKTLGLVPDVTGYRMF